MTPARSCALALAAGALLTRCGGGPAPIAPAPTEPPRAAADAASAPSSPSAPTASSAVRPEAAPVPWSPRPKTISMRTGIEPPLVVRPDGTSNLAAAKDVVRVSDHYSACFVTRAATLACWGIGGGGTWNGVAKRDRDVALTDVSDVAINQTHACAVKKDGTLACWGSDGKVEPQTLAAPAKEIAVSVQGRACALLADGTVASVTRWTSSTWERIRVDGAPVRGVGHLLACDRWLFCGERERGGSMCVPAWETEDVRTGHREAQQRLIQEIGRVPGDRHLAMNDSATVFCAYSSSEVTCFSSKLGTTSTVGGLTGISEVAVGWATLGGKSLDAAVCARVDSGEVRCWDGAESRPAPVVVR